MRNNSPSRFWNWFGKSFAAHIFDAALAMRSNSDILSCNSALHLAVSSHGFDNLIGECIEWQT